MPALPRLRYAALSVLALIVTLGLTSARSTIAAPAAPGECVPGVMPPVVVSTDEDGYTTWSTDYTEIDCYWANPTDKIRFPITLDGVDPTTLDDVSVTVWYRQTYFNTDADDSYGDTSWDVLINPSWDEFGVYGGTSIGSLGAVGGGWTNATFGSLDPTLIIDGENNIWPMPMSYGKPITGCSHCATTAVNVGKVQIRATVNNMDIKSVSPEPDTENVDYRRHDPSRIQVQFTQPVDTKTVTPDSFQLYYLDQNGDKAFVSGTFRFSKDKKSFEFRPAQDLLDGVLYTARIWGQENAIEEDNITFVKSATGGMLKWGMIWSFWTVPDVQIRIVPVQVLEGTSLIASKPTVVRTFLRWDVKPNVHEDAQRKYIEPYDIILTWGSASGSDRSPANDPPHWRNYASDWTPEYGSEEGRRKREYQVFTDELESYEKAEKVAALDSVNFYGFRPGEIGTYSLAVEVQFKDSAGRISRKIAGRTVEVVDSGSYGVKYAAPGVGADYSRTGAVNVADPLNHYIAGARAIYPLTTFPRPPSVVAMPSYKPVTNFWAADWSAATATWWTTTTLLKELEAMCARTEGCASMVGIVNRAWLVDLGTTLPEWYPNAALVTDQADPNTFNRFVMAHELGHLMPWEHNTLMGGEGFDVGKRADRRQSVASMSPTGEKILSRIFDEMVIDPVESPPPERLWIATTQYAALMARFGATASAAEVSADNLIVVSGGIVPNSPYAVSLTPWYVTAPGTWTAPKTGPYSLVFLNGSTVLSTYNFGVYNDGVNLSRPWPFAFKAPLPPTATKAQIRLTSSGAVLAEVTAGSPSATITSPAGGVTWSSVQAISWSGSASGYAVDFSSDNGATWTPLAIDITTASLSVDTRGLPNTSQAKVRVVASQGLTNATATSAAFTIANAPVISSVLPAASEIDVPVGQPVVVSFSDEMDPATLTASTFYVQAGGANVPGTIAYDSTEDTATFVPKTRFAYSTVYTANVTAGVRNQAGVAISAGRTWTFTTEADQTAPKPIAFQPEGGAAEVPLNARVVVSFNKALNDGTVTGARFTVATAKGTPVPVTGSIAYDAASRSIVFTPTANLAPRTLYKVTLKAGIADTLANATKADSSWLFTTGRAATTATSLAGSYADFGSDTNGDGLYEWLVVRLGVQATEAAKFSVQGTLVDANGERMGSAATQVTLPVGFSWVDLQFSGQDIGGHGVDGPYHLTNVLLFKLNATDLPLWDTTVSAREAAQTQPYPAARFAATLRLTGIPDLRVNPGSTAPLALNLGAYTQTSLSPLKYNIVGNTDPTAGVTVTSAGSVSVAPPAESMWSPAYRGSTDVTVEAVAGVIHARDTFRVVVDWAARIALPRLVRGVTPATTAPSGRPTWHVPVSDDFEGSFGWSSWSSIYFEGWPPPPGGLGWYSPDKRDCQASSGTFSVWPYGGSDDGSNLACGAPYPNGYTAWFGWLSGVSLKHTSAAEFRIKVWTNLAPGDDVCALVTTTRNPTGIGVPPFGEPFYGVCRSGQTNGWEELVLDLSNVPVAGNMLGVERVYPVVRFRTDQSGSRPDGAYIDDAVFRICPEGIQCE